MARNKHFKVEAQFIIPISKIVVAETEAKALRKARDSAVKYMKIKPKHLDRQTYQIFDMD